MLLLLLESALAAAAWRGARGWESSAARGQRREARGIPTSRTSAPSKVPSAVSGAAKVTAGRANQIHSQRRRAAIRLWMHARMASQVHGAMKQINVHLCINEKGQKERLQARERRRWARCCMAYACKLASVLRLPTGTCKRRKERLLPLGRGVGLGNSAAAAPYRRMCNECSKPVSKLLL